MSHPKDRGQNQRKDAKEVKELSQFLANNSNSVLQNRNISKVTLELGIPDCELLKVMPRIDQNCDTTESKAKGSVAGGYRSFIPEGGYKRKTKGAISNNPRLLTQYKTLEEILKNSRKKTDSDFRHTVIHFLSSDPLVTK